MTLRLLTVTLVVFGLAPATAAQHAFDWHIEDSGSVNAFLELTEFHTDIVNTGSVEDTYRIELVKNMPATWTTTMCDTTLCYPPFILTLEYTVPPGESVFVGVNITPDQDAGVGISSVTVTSLGNPALTAAADFHVASEGLDVLLVDDDGGDTAEAAVTASIGADGRAHAVWPREAAGKLAAAELGAFPAVVWVQGGNSGGIDADDRTAVTTYLANGGRVLLTGQDTAWALSDPASPAQGPAQIQWLSDTFGAIYDLDDAGANTVAGWPGDEIGDGLFAAIDLGGRNPDPDAVVPHAAATRFLIYGSGAAAGVRRPAGTGKTAFLPFDLAGLADAGQRDTLTARILAWFDDQASAAPDLPGRPLADVRAVPNPFNPATEVRFALDRAGDVQLLIHDVAGRLVRTIAAGALPAGDTAIAWDGRDDRGRPAAGGVYLARVVTDRTVGVARMVLVK